MKEVLLIKTDNNWADEMDLAGFALFTPEKWREHLSKVKRAFKVKSDLGMSVGSNEEIDFNSYEDYKKQITVQKISLIQAQMYCRHFKIKINELGENCNYRFESYGMLTLLGDDHLNDCLENEDSE